MLKIRIRFTNSDPRQIICAPGILLASAAVFCWAMIHATAAAQARGMGATVTRTAPGAILYVGGAPSDLKVNSTLQPGDIIDTGVSGSVVIDLGDGSQVTIFPRSRVELKDFRAGAPWRDLLKVTVGRVRATISHKLKRPNPYRVFSPIASIAVRGTDFLVTVELSGETRVLVYEGLVEVGSLVSPQKTILVRPGRNIIVRPDGDISMVTAVPRGELNEIKNLRYLTIQGEALRNAYDSHRNSYTGYRSSRFTAFNDLHLDGLQNPAYATEFRQPDGRLYLVPSFSPEYDNISSNYTLSPQASYFRPLDSRIVVGAGAAVTRTDIGGATGYNYLPDPNQAARYTNFDGNVKFTTTNMSLIAARRFGQTERTSLGIKFDYLIDRSVYSFNRDSNESWMRQPTFEEGKASAHRAGLSVGLTQDLGDDKKLGIYYRYSMGSVENRYRQSGARGYINGALRDLPDSADFRTQPGHSSEVGVLFRGSVTRRLFYGVESSMLVEQSQEEGHIPFPLTSFNIIYNSTQTYLKKRRVRQGMAGVGIGYALRPRTVLSLDLSIGGSQEDSLGQTHYDFLPPRVIVSSPDDYLHNRFYFKAYHIGGQTDVWRNLFAGVSFLHSRERKHVREGLDVPEKDRSPFNFYSSDYSHYETTESLNINVGWRLTPNLIAQYGYSTASYSYWRNAPNHTLMFRYEFGRRKESENANAKIDAGYSGAGGNLPPGAAPH
jgi:FecR-like protein